MHWAQIVINGLITASELGVIAIGLTMTFSVLRFAYFAFTLNTALHWNLTAAMMTAAALVGLVGIAIDRGIFRFMRNAGEVTPMIASLGLAIAIRHTVQAVWGPQILRYDYEVRPGLRILGGYVTAPQIGVFVIATVAMLVFHVLLQNTRIGKAMR